MLYRDDIIGWLKENRVVNDQVFDLIETRLKKVLYYYGKHHNGNGQISKPRFLMRKFFSLVHNLVFNIITRRTAEEKKGLSLAYFNYDSIVSKETGIRIDRCFHFPKRYRSSFGGINLTLRGYYIDYLMEFKSFKYLISKEFSNLVIEYEKKMLNKLKNENYEFLFVPEDLSFQSRLYIKLFKKLGKPTFFLAHGGMPSIYDQVIDSRTDYVTMWGEQQVKAYVNNGYDASRFFVTGHPLYIDTQINQKNTLRYGTDNILVLGKDCDGVPHEKDHTVANRSKTIRYLYEIELALRNIGVSRVRLRLHPSQNIEWYSDFIDLSFFSLDTEPLNESLFKSSLVIGPVSTVFVDSLINGVSYLVYEPLINKENIAGRALTLPLDGSDQRIYVAKSPDELQQFLVSNSALSSELINEFAQFPIDMSEVIKLIQ